MGEEASAQLVGPLAVVEHDQRGSGLGAQRIEQHGQGAHGPHLAELVRAELGGLLGAEQPGQLGEGDGHRRSVGAESVTQVGPELLVLGDRTNQVARHAGEDLERSLRGLIEALAVQMADVVVGPTGELLQQAALPSTRLGADEHDAALPRAGVGQLALELGELGLSPDEGRFGQRLAAIPGAEDERWLGHALRPGRDQLVDVVEQRLGELVPLGGVTPDEPIDDVPERAGHRRVEPRGRGGHLLLEDVTDPLPAEDRFPAQALDDGDADRVQIRPLVHGAGQQAGLLGGEVAHAADGDVPDVDVEQLAPGEAEVDEDRVLDRVAVQDHVSRLHVTVQDPVVVGVAEGGDHITCDAQRVVHRQRSVAEARREAAARDPGRHDVCGITVDTLVQEADQVGMVQAGEDEALVLEPAAGGLGQRTGLGQFEDHGMGSVPGRNVVGAAGSVLEVLGQVGLHTLGAVEERSEPVPAGDHTVHVHRRHRWCSPPGSLVVLLPASPHRRDRLSGSPIVRMDTMRRSGGDDHR